MNKLLAFLPSISRCKRPAKHGISHSLTARPNFFCLPFFFTGYAKKMAEQAAAQFNSQRAATAATEDEGEQDPLTGVCVCVILCVCVCHMFRGG